MNDAERHPVGVIVSGHSVVSIDSGNGRSREWSVRTRLQNLISDLVDGGIRLEQANREFEKEFILATLQKYRGNLSMTARSLGIHRNTLHHKIHGLRLKEWLPRRNGSRPTVKSS